ncbi:MAG: sigma-54-dependent Fis family transcriptional regulator [Deltaproteobacteria bacterium]|nr:MAG: sigma-54-dependent Fis family transcriptional regulator [Deltaproteobacteria bacterium]
MKKKADKKIKPTILIVDDDEGMRDTLESILRDDYDVLKAGDGEEALGILEDKNVNIVFLDIIMPGMDGLTVLKNIGQYHKDVDVIMGSVVKKAEHIVNAMKLGAYDYLTKGFDYDEVRFKINRLVEHQKREREIVSLKERLKDRMENEFIVGNSPLIRKVWETVEALSESDLSIFISGEPSTGKRLLARKLHERSDRKYYPFVPVNLHLIPKDSIDYVLFGSKDNLPLSLPKDSPANKIELSHRGTLFLSGIECLSERTQLRLLTAVERKNIERIGCDKPIRVDFRLITKSDKTIDDLQKEGKLGKELLAEISAVKIELPPLRERLEDVPELARYFVKRYSSNLNKDFTDITPQALSLLSNYHWPGNVGELENLVQKLVISATGPSIEIDDIPWEYRLFDRKALRPYGKAKGFLHIARDAVERDLIYKALQRNNWSRRKTAEDLEIPYDTLKTKLRKFKLLKS